MTDPFTTARNDIAGLPGHGMSADVQVAEQRVGEATGYLVTRPGYEPFFTRGDAWAFSAAQVQEGWTQTPLYATPKPADPTSVAGERMREALIEAREYILELVHSRNSEYEGTDEEAVGFIDAALATNAPDAAKREGEA